MSVLGNDVQMVDITVRVKFLEYVKTNDLKIKTDYYLDPIMRPEELCYKLYGSYKMTWVLLVLNNVYSIYEDWVQPQDVVDALLIYQYGSLEDALTTPLKYFDINGYEVGETSPNIETVKSALQVYMEENERKRSVSVVSVDVMSKIATDFGVMMQ